LVGGYEGIVKCHGISQDPQTKNYLMVMDYKEGGNLRDCLKNSSCSELSCRAKFEKLRNIASGLNSIHQQNLVHRDFHSGNILNDSFDKSGYVFSYIADLGLSQLVNSQTEEGKIFGVLPYMAPEVLQGQPYTQASDIYSFGIVAYELLANSYPYHEYKDSDEMDLTLRICQGLRPNIDELKIPRELKGLIKRC